MPQVTTPAAGHIRLESKNYLLRTMGPEDAELDWGEWLASPTTARLLNTVPRALSFDERKAYVVRFDSQTSHLLGIWERASGEFVGFWSIYVDERSKEFLLNVLVGSTNDRHKGALKETRYLIYEHFFDVLGMNAVRCSVAGRNEQMIAFLKENHWIHEGNVRRPTPDGGSVDILHFRMTRDIWLQRQAALQGNTA
jgi:RimJ/RimL family protein N-acetyltransferase